MSRLTEACDASLKRIKEKFSLDDESRRFLSEESFTISSNRLATFEHKNSGIYLEIRVEVHWNQIGSSCSLELRAFKEKPVNKVTPDWKKSTHNSLEGCKLLVKESLDFIRSLDYLPKVEKQHQEPSFFVAGNEVTILPYDSRVN